MKIEEPEAIAIAQRFVQDKGWKVGDVCRVKHLAKEKYPERIRHIIASGRWLVSFAYAGRPLTDEEKRSIIFPPLDAPTNVYIDDETGTAEVLAAL